MWRAKSSNRCSHRRPAVTKSSGGSQIMKGIAIVLLCLAFLYSVTCVDAAAQATAQITGTAKDQTGAVLPGVEIVVTQSQTGATRNTVTNEAGLFILPSLPLGSYQLEASLPGFRTYVQTGIVLQVDNN